MTGRIAIASPSGRSNTTEPDVGKLRADAEAMRL
jgi:hypothetical protein